ncbi:MAG: NusA-like transcription termination signal-binding factor [Candidatus Altiarchaeales archaeon]|nr:NusA-like transcription termination signal-binding factor [Candidatus Altiarchaeales archaeon]MBD3415787.1 NusA-like transcription termination signal-binding factor [Candidatus Altiarchaeales archaeon]
MNKIRFDADEIKLISMFESTTGAKVNDFLMDSNLLCFLVKQGDMGLAIGKNGSKVEKLRRSLGRNILVLEHSDDPEKFIENMFHPVEVHGLEVGDTPDGLMATVQISIEDRSRAIGREGSRIRMVKALAKRHHNIGNINLRAV